jgi:hypothetical protein
MTDLLLDIRLWAALVVGGALVALGDQVGQWRAGPDRRVRTDTITKERALVRRDTVTETVPQTVIRYDTVREVDTAHVPIPVDMDLKGAIRSQPVDISDEQITLTYFDPQSRQWTQNRYAIPEKHWALWPAVQIRTTLSGLQASALANLRWRRVTVFGGYTQVDDDRGVTVGVELRPFTVSW